MHPNFTCGALSCRPSCPRQKALAPKRNTAHLHASPELMRRTLLLRRWEAMPPSVRVSAHTGHGKSELLLMMAELRELFKRHTEASG